MVNSNRYNTFGKGADQQPDIEERVVNIRRCSKVVKGGRNFSFSALVVVGNRNGKIGFGIGKANEVSEAIRKGSIFARNHLISILLSHETIPHEMQAKFGGARILIRPAAPGTGVIAGGGMRAVLELCGVSNVLAKSLGSSNTINVVQATVKALSMLTNRKKVLEKRGIASL